MQSLTKMKKMKKMQGEVMTRGQIHKHNTQLFPIHRVEGGPPDLTAKRIFFPIMLAAGLWIVQ